jgi:hypothetical protein
MRPKYRVNERVLVQEAGKAEHISVITSVNMTRDSGGDSIAYRLAGHDTPVSELNISGRVTVSKPRTRRTVPLPGTNHTQPAQTAHDITNVGGPAIGTAPAAPLAAPHVHNPLQSSSHIPG